MQTAILIDFGSTYTKVTAVDLEDASLLGAASAPTTVATDITEGLEAALSQLRRRVPGRRLESGERWACSSAAGGLKLVAIGLVPELTAEAARSAALGAGARVLRSFAYRLGDEELAEIRRLNPDLVLLAGGTDGGNRDVVLHNAGQLAASGCEAPVVVACNSEVAGEAVALLRRAGINARKAPNVMPRLGVLAVDGAREAIREVFLERIVEAKGLRRAERYVGRVLMPTPAAVLAAARLLSEGVGDEPGWGELVVVDVGGATTDVHSAARGEPEPGVMLKGLPEPFMKRTVEGDLGVRVSAPSLVEALGAEAVARRAGWDKAAVVRRAEKLGECPHTLPRDEGELAFDAALAGLAVEEAVRRHCGHLEELATPAGLYRFQRGKNLRKVRAVIGTGGVIAHHPRPEHILRWALGSTHERILRPVRAALVVDERYVLSAAGLLAERHPRTALRLMKRYLKVVEEAPYGEDVAASR